MVHFIVNCGLDNLPIAIICFPDFCLNVFASATQLETCDAGPKIQNFNTSPQLSSDGLTLVICCIDSILPWLPVADFFSQPFFMGSSGLTECHTESLNVAPLALPNVHVFAVE